MNNTATSESGDTLNLFITVSGNNDNNVNGRLRQNGRRREKMITTTDEQLMTRTFRNNTDDDDEDAVSSLGKSMGTSQFATNPFPGDKHIEQPDQETQYHHHHTEIPNDYHGSDHVELDETKGRMKWVKIALTFVTSIAMLIAVACVAIVVLGKRKEDDISSLSDPFTAPTASPDTTTRPTNAHICGCESCTPEALNRITSTGESCGELIHEVDFTSNPYYTTEEAACSLIAGRYPECGTACDPLQCNENRDMSRVNLVELSPSSPIYCFPEYQDRVRWGGVWGNYMVEVKESKDGLCGPGDNKFSRDTVSIDGDELTLQFKEVQFKEGTYWTGSEVRVVIPFHSEPFNYGTYSFRVKSVAVTGSDGVRKAHNLPPGLILGLFTWDATERFDVRENYGHEVDVEIGRWGDENAAHDAHFIVQPPEDLQWYNFSTATNEEGFNQGDGHTYEFTWNPGVINWQTDAGNGHTSSYSTRDAISQGVPDRVQCMPADVEIRMNLWHLDGLSDPLQMVSGDVVTVVIDKFMYKPSGQSFVPDDWICSKDCQCSGKSYCTDANFCAPLPASDSTGGDPVPETLEPSPKFTTDSGPSIATEKPSSPRVGMPHSSPSSSPTIKADGNQKPSSQPTGPSTRPSAEKQDSTSVPRIHFCGCETCTREALEQTTSSGETCGELIEAAYLSIDPFHITEEGACSLVAGQNPECGPACDPLQCSDDDMSRVNLVDLSPTHSIYCFPKYEDRFRWDGVWGNYVVEVKESGEKFCGPGDNKFSRETVSIAGDELTLQFKEVQSSEGKFWTGSEVRVVMPFDQEPFNYGTYSFRVKSISLRDSEDVRIAHNIPPSLVLGLFTWDATERFDVRENYLHEVDVEISRWGDEDAVHDAHFVVQPLEDLQWYNFSTALPGQSFDEGNGHTYEFTWNPGVIHWQTDAGIGHKHSYSTEDAISQGAPDRVQCMPADVEVRLNLWHMYSITDPLHMVSGDVLTVVIDNFTYTPSEQSFVPDGGVCSKDCQCSENSFCTGGNKCAPVE